jgi:hypothetical protein
MDGLAAAPGLRVWMAAGGQNGTPSDGERERANPSGEDTHRVDRWFAWAGKALALGLVGPEFALWGARPQAIAFLGVLWGAIDLAQKKREGKL